MKKHNKHKLTFDKLRDRLYFVLPFVLVLLMVFNFYSFFVNKSHKSDLYNVYQKSYASFTNEIFNLRSSYIHSVSNLNDRINNLHLPSDFPPSPPPPVGTNNLDRPVCLKSCYYLFLLYLGRRCIRYYGRLYEEGSLMSLGRIKLIFPDRVYFDNGDWIENTHNPDFSNQLHIQNQNQNKGSDYDHI